jgi:hypothetical protein
MDQSIRLRRPDEAMPSPPARRTLTLSAHPAAANAYALRKAILDCAAAAIVAEPTNTEARVYSFLARLSATMEGLGEPDLDCALWKLMETKSIALERA